MRCAGCGSSSGLQRGFTPIRPITHTLQLLWHSSFSPAGKLANMCEYSMLGGWFQGMINNTLLAWELAECACSQVGGQEWLGLSMYQVKPTISHTVETPLCVRKLILIMHAVGPISPPLTTICLVIVWLTCSALLYLYALSSDWSTTNRRP